MRRTLMTIEGDYSLRVVKERNLYHELISRSVDGWFQHVWHVNPLVGADPLEPRETAVGPPQVTELQPGHTVLEGHVRLVHYLGWVPPLNLLLAQASLFLRLSRIIRREKVSLIRAGDPYYLGLLALLLAKLHRRPLIIKVAANYDAIYEATGTPAYPRLLRKRSLEKRIERLVLAKADLVAAANRNNLEYVLANGASQDRATIFRYGSWVDPVHFRDDDPGAVLFEELGLAGRDVLVFVGRLEPVKHPDDVLHAFAKLKQGADGSCLLIIGDGSLRNDLPTLADQLGVSGSVVFSGARNQEEIRSALRHAAVILAPLAGRALVEATLSARPLVAYDVEWHAELIDANSGRLVPYRDTAAMAEAAGELLSDPELASQLGERGRRKCLEMMDPVKLAKHEQRAYERVLKRG